MSALSDINIPVSKVVGWVAGIIAVLIAAAGVAWASNLHTDIENLKADKERLARIETKLESISADIHDLKEAAHGK